MACNGLTGIAAYGDAYHSKTLQCGKLNYL
ncbi:MAG: hypothetical protein JWR09_1764 [Mucilaginibacter sp.]|nr:hypothetical protein [Mucilaginibacter sp.]